MTRYFLRLRPKDLMVIALLTATPQCCARSASLTTKSRANAAVTADMNGYGALDLVVAHCCGQVDDTYLLGNGDGTFHPAGGPAKRRVYGPG